MMININIEQQRHKHGTNITSNNDDNDIRSHSGSSCLAVSDIQAKMMKHRTPTKPSAKPQVAIPGRTGKRHATYLHRTFGRRDTTPRGFVGSTELYHRERPQTSSSSMPKLMGHPEASDAGTSFPIDTLDQLDAALARVGSACQVVLDLNDRMKGKKLKAGLSMEEVPEF